MTLGDIGNELDAPDATTIDFEALIIGAMGGLMGWRPRRRRARSAA